MFFFLFSFFRHAFSEFPPLIALKLCHMVGIWPNFIMQVQKLGGHSPPKKSGCQKHAKFRSILDHFRFWSRISPERLKISKIGRRYKLSQFLLRLMKKVRWTLVHPKNFNRENLKCGLKFSVLATITSGQVGVSPQNIFHATCHGTGDITWV